jgi:hypothetical protein
MGSFCNSFLVPFQGVPPLGLVVKSPMVAIDSKMDLAKIVQPFGLRLNYSKQTT